MKLTDDEALRKLLERLRQLFDRADPDGRRMLLAVVYELRDAASHYFGQSDPDFALRVVQQAALAVVPWDPNAPPQPE
jgi:hypothetical protein